MIGVGQVTAPEATTRTAIKHKAAVGEPSFETVMKDFLGEARMTPQQRIRRDVLKENRLTEADLAAMSPAERKAIEDKIAPIIRKRIEMTEDFARRQGRQIGLSSL